MLLSVDAYGVATSCYSLDQAATSRCTLTFTMLMISCSRSVLASLGSQSRSTLRRTVMVIGGARLCSTYCGVLLALFCVFLIFCCAGLNDLVEWRRTGGAAHSVRRTQPQQCSDCHSDQSTRVTITGAVSIEFNQLLLLSSKLTAI